MDKDENTDVQSDNEQVPEKKREFDMQGFADELARIIDMGREVIDTKKWKKFE